ncbi:MAG: hypothetical protein PGN29_19540 [Gordonia paraffinivorans]
MTTRAEMHDLSILAQRKGLAVVHSGDRVDVIKHDPSVADPEKLRPGSFQHAGQVVVFGNLDVDQAREMLEALPDHAE